MRFIRYPPYQSLPTYFLSPQRIHRGLRSLEHCLAFNYLLIIWDDNSIVEHGRHDFGLQMRFKEFVLSSLAGWPDRVMEPACDY